MAEHNKEQLRYVLKMMCNHMTFLVPLIKIEIILPREELILAQSMDMMAIYQNQEIPCFSLCDLLECAEHCEEPYAVLMQSDTIKFFLYVEHIEDVVQVRDSSYKLPKYMQESFSYITECFVLQHGELAFFIDIDNLLYSYHQRNGDEHI